MKYLARFFASLWLMAQPAAPALAENAESKLMRVTAPVADVRSEPKDAATDTYIHDPLEETQLLFGETVRLIQAQDGWALVECLGQQEFTHKKKWEGYPGWVRIGALGPDARAASGAKRGVVRRFWADIFFDPGEESARTIRVPFGSLVEIVSDNGSWYEIAGPAGRGRIRRADVVLSDGRMQASRENLAAHVWKNARRFIGVPYYWGGLSPYGKDYKSAVTGVDCSGLIHLCYRAAGVTIPRDSHEQWMKSAPLKKSEIRRGDLIFLANADKPEKIVHVAMYAGGEFMIEGPGTGMAVRRVTFKKKFGRRLAGIESGDRVSDGKKIVYFGRPSADAY